MSNRNLTFPKVFVPQRPTQHDLYLHFADRLHLSPEPRALWLPCCIVKQMNKSRIPTNIEDIPHGLYYIHLTPEIINNYYPNLYNYTRGMCEVEFKLIDQCILDKLNVIRSVTGEKLKRLLNYIFQTHDLRSSSLCQDRFYIHENNFPFYWVFGNVTLWGEDIPSLWAYITKNSYIESIHNIYNHLLTHENTDEFERDDKKGYWVPDQDILDLNIQLPWLFYSLCVNNSTYIFNYFKNNYLVGCSCTIPHPKGDLHTCFSLMRHTKNHYVRWFPIYPKGTDLFFLRKPLHGEDILFMPDELTALKTFEDNIVDRNSYSIPPNTTPLACPGGLQRLIDSNVEMASGRQVYIVLPHNLQDDERFLSQLVEKFSHAGATSLLLYRIQGRENNAKLNCKNEYWSHAFRSINYDKQNPITIDPSLSITKPGQKIPGSDVEQRDVFSPLFKSGQLIWLYGPEKSGKSWLARVMAHVISYGGELWGKYKAESGLKVLYIDGEMPGHTLESHFEKELAGLDYKEGRKFDIKAARDKNNTEGEINLLTPKWQEWFKNALIDYDVVFLDCYYSLIGKIDIPGEFRELLIYWINKNKTFIIIDHTNKENDLSGSINKLRFADLAISVEPQEDQKIKISFPRVRYLSPDESHEFTLQKIFTDTSFCLELVQNDTLSKTEEAISIENMREVLVYVMKQKGIKVCEIEQHIGYKHTSIYKWISKIEESISSNTPTFSHQNKLIEQYNLFDYAELMAEAQRIYNLKNNSTA